MLRSSARDTPYLLATMATSLTLSRVTVSDVESESHCELCRTVLMLLDLTTIRQ